MVQKEQTNNKITTLETKIAFARDRLHSLWDLKGRTDAEVLNASVKLDTLINEYHRLFREE